MFSSLSFKSCEGGCLFAYALLKQRRSYWPCVDEKGSDPAIQGFSHDYLQSIHSLLWYRTVLDLNIGNSGKVSLLVRICTGTVVRWEDLAKLYKRCNEAAHKIFDQSC